MCQDIAYDEKFENIILLCKLNVYPLEDPYCSQCKKKVYISMHRDENNNGKYFKVISVSELYQFQFQYVEFYINKNI